METLKALDLSSIEQRSEALGNKEGRMSAVLDYSQSRERILGRHNIQITRTIQPNKKRFVVHRIIGSGDLWITEFVLTYDDQPFYTVSIMEFRGVKVAHETQYFAGPFEAGESRKKWVTNMDSPKDLGIA